MKIITEERAGFIISYSNVADFNQIYQEIFVNEDYYFQTANKKPRIIDAGSNIGLATLYFKRLYPEAEITCFEPNPFTFNLLKKNIHDNNLSDITLINAALHNSTSPAFCYGDIFSDTPNTLGNTLINNLWGTAGLNAYQDKVEVETELLSNYLKDKIDFLKLDIEGSEQLVLTEAKDFLKNIHEMVLEFHGSAASRDINNLEVILNILSDVGLKFEKQDIDIEKMIPNDPEIYQAVKSKQPHMALIRAKKMETHHA